MVNKWRQAQQPSESQILGWIMVTLRTYAVLTLASQWHVDLKEAARRWYEAENVVNKAGAEFIQMTEKEA